MEWVPVESSVFVAAAYAAETRILYLHFRSGEIYRYFAFPEEQYRDFLDASSKGRYFSSNIRDRHRCERLARFGSSGTT